MNMEDATWAHEQRQQRARMMRREQLQRYEGREREQPAGRAARRRRRKSGNRVAFGAREVVRDAVLHCNNEEVKMIMDSRLASPNTSIEANGASLLHLCCMKNNVIGAELVLENGANINICDDDLWTPLHVAAACGHRETIKLLLEYNADCTLLDVDGNFAYDSSDDTEIKALLLKHMMFKGIYEQDLKGLRSRQAKAMLAAVKENIEKNYNLDQHNKNGVALLHTAAANGYHQVARLLIDAGANIDSTDDLGYTPLHVAAKFNQLRLVKLLLRRNANPQLQSYATELAIKLTESDTIAELLTKASGERESVKLQTVKRSPSASLQQPPAQPAPDPSPLHNVGRDPHLSPEQFNTVALDMDEFDSARARSRSLSHQTSISKLEELFEAETLSERDTYSEGADNSTQGPALRRLRVETTRIRQSGYPTQLTFENFLKRYRLLQEVYAPPSSKLQPSEAVSEVLRRARTDGWKMGDTRVFLKFKHGQELLDHGRALWRLVLLLQNCIRNWIAKKMTQRLVQQRRAQPPSAPYPCRGSSQRQEGFVSPPVANQGLVECGRIEQGWETTPHGSHNPPTEGAGPQTTTLPSSMDGYVLPTSPRDDVFEAEEIYDDFDSCQAAVTHQRIHSIPSVGNDDVILMSTGVVDRPQVIFEEEAEEIYDDGTCLQQQQQQQQQHRTQVAPPPQRRTSTPGSTSPSGDEVEEIYDDSASVQLKMQQAAMADPTEDIYDAITNKSSIPLPSHTGRKSYIRNSIPPLGVDQSSSQYTKKEFEIPFSNNETYLYLADADIQDLEQSIKNSPHGGVSDYSQLGNSDSRPPPELPPKSPQKTARVPPPKSSSPSPPPIPTRTRQQPPQHVKPRPLSQEPYRVSISPTAPILLSGRMSPNSPPLPPRKTSLISSSQSRLPPSLAASNNAVLRRSKAVRTQSSGHDQRRRESAPPLPLNSVFYQKPGDIPVEYIQPSTEDSSSSSSSSSPHLTVPKKVQVAQRKSDPVRPTSSQINIPIHRMPLPPIPNPGKQEDYDYIDYGEGDVYEDPSVSVQIRPFDASAMSEAQPYSPPISRKMSVDVHVESSKLPTLPSRKTKSSSALEMINQPSPPLPQRQTNQSPLVSTRKSQSSSALPIDIANRPRMEPPKRVKTHSTNSPHQAGPPPPPPPVPLSTRHSRAVSPPPIPPSRGAPPLSPPPVGPVAAPTSVDTVAPQAPVPQPVSRATRYKKKHSAPSDAPPPPPALGESPATPPQPAMGGVPAPPPPPAIGGPPPPPPPPPAIGGPPAAPKLSSVRAQPSESVQPSARGGGGGDLLAGIGSVQLRKASERTLPEATPRKQETTSAGGAVGNLMAEMQKFQLRKATKTKKSTGPESTPPPPDATQTLPFTNILKPVSSHPSPPVRCGSPPTAQPRPRVMPRRPKLVETSLPPASPPVTRRSNATEQPSNGHGQDCSVPEWKRALMEKKQREEQEKLAAEQASTEAEEVRWANVPEWKRRAMEEKQKRTTAAGAMEEPPEWKRSIAMRK